MRINAYNKGGNMKRFDLIRKFLAKGWYLKRHGGSHDVYTDGNNIEVIPRHPDINEQLARTLIRKWRL
jgi:mRNA interferase HicA